MDGSLDDLPKSAEDDLELRVEQAMEQYLDQLESGTPPDRVEFLRQHADIADELSQQIEAIEFLHLATPEVLGAGDDDELSHPPVADATALGDFQLIRPIGRGGMGIVYEAIQISLDRRVAVKVLPFASMLDAKQRKRFKNEARAAATLDHPNIVPIYFIGQERGVHFYAMQLIEGQSLTEVIRGLSDTEQKPADSTTITTTFSTQRVRSRDKYYRSIAELGAQIAQALQHAHEQGIVHRDIKPGNLLLDEAGKVWITDFGLASFEKNDTVTGAGDVLGTFAYMSPEQATGATLVDARSDVYSLAATLYELLTLQRPTAVLGPASTNTGLSPHSLRTFDRRLPADLETIILKGLSDDPADRYHSAGAFADDLQRFVAGRTIQARRPSLTDRTLKWIGRHRAIALSAAASLALMCCVLLASTALVWRANQQSAQALLQSEEHARHIQELLYMADMQVAYQTWDDEQLGQTREILERYLPKPGEPDLRGFEWYALRSIAQEIEPIVFGKHEAPVNQLAVFPDGRRVASVGDDQKLRIWDLASRELLGVADAADSSVEPLFSVAVSPDGKTIATGSDCVLLWDAETLERRQSLASYEYNVQSIAFSPDGNRIAVATRYDLVQLYTITGELINEYMGAARHESLEFTPDGQRILVPSRRDNELDGTKTGFIRAWNADLSQVEFDLCPANHIATNFTQTAISRDGRFFALAEQSAVNPICIVDAESHDVVLRISEEQDQVATLSLSHDGRRLAIGYVNGVIAVPEIDDLSNGTTKTNRKRLFQAHQGALTAVRFIDDRRFLSSGTDGRLKYWELPRQEMSVSMSNAFVGDISISPDDQTLAYIDDDGIQLRSVEGKHLASVPCKTAHRICFSRDSAVVACCVTNSNSVYLLSAATGQQLLHISLATTPRDICLSPTEDRLAIINGIGNVIVWNTRTGEQVNDTLSLYDEREYRDYRCLYSPDGRTLICNGMDEMVSVDIATMTPIRRDPMLIRQFASCFSPDGTWFAVALSNGTIELWKWPSFEHFGSLHGHEGEVRDIAFTQDDRLVSIGQDGTTRVWSPSQLREIGILARSPYVSECFALTANATRMWIGYNRQTEPGENPVMLEFDVP